jgi:hypothetical protein
MASFCLPYAGSGASETGIPKLELGNQNKGIVQMDINVRLAVLEQLYTIYDTFSQNLDVACQRYCSQCCTCNVTLTTLEAHQIIKHLIASGETDLLRRLENKVPEKRFQPKITTNGIANYCIQGKPLPEEESDAAWGSCPFLEQNECPFYLARPFGCRCFVSKQLCGKSGYADVDSFVITVNNVFLQYIEHIDLQGYSGNLSDMLRFMRDEENRGQYEAGTLKPTADSPLIPNCPLKVLMIPPEHQDRIMPILEVIQKIK